MTIWRNNTSIRLDRADFAAIYPTFLRGKNNTIGFVLREIKLFSDIFGDGKNVINELVAKNIIEGGKPVPFFEVAIKFNKIIKIPRFGELDITIRKIPYQEIDCTGMMIRFTKNIFRDGFRMFLQSNGQRIVTWSWSFQPAKRKNGFIANALVRLINKPLELRSRYLASKK